jgi:hypothetical protein
VLVLETRGRDLGIPHPDQFNAGIAQMVEQWFCKPQVAGSIPAAGTINNSAGVVHRKSVDIIQHSRQSGET